MSVTQGFIHKVAKSPDADLAATRIHELSDALLLEAYNCGQK